MRYSDDDQPPPLDSPLIDLLQQRHGIATVVVLCDGRRLTVHNIAWGYDAGDQYAHITTNISPCVDGEPGDFFFTSEVCEVVDLAGTPLRPLYDRAALRRGDAADTPRREVSGLVLDDHVHTLLTTVSGLIDYAFDDLDWGAVAGALPTTNAASRWYDYPLVGTPSLNISLAINPGAALVSVSISGRMGDVLAARLQVQLDRVARVVRASEPDRGTQRGRQQL